MEKNKIKKVSLCLSNEQKDKLHKASTLILDVILSIDLKEKKEVGQYELQKIYNNLMNLRFGGK